MKQRWFHGTFTTTRTNIRQFHYLDEFGDPAILIDDSAAQETHYKYDEFGRLVKTTFHDATFTETEYDNFGRVISETNQLGQTRTFEYDPHGRLEAVELPEVTNPATSLPEAPRYEYGYDLFGNQNLIRDPLGRETRFTFDSQGRQLTRTLPLGFGAGRVARPELAKGVVGRAKLSGRPTQAIPSTDVLGCFRTSLRD